MSLTSFVSHDLYFHLKKILLSQERRKDRKIERRKDRKTEKQKDKKTERQKYRKTERKKDRKNYIHSLNL